MRSHCRTLALCAVLLTAGGEARPQDALIACKSKTVQSSFDTIEDCFSYFSKVEPKVKSTAVQKALMSTLLQLEEIEELLDDEERILEDSIARGEKQHPEANRKRKRDLQALLALPQTLLGGDGGAGSLNLGGLLEGLGGGGEGGDDNSILGIIRSVKRTVKEIISNIVQLIFGTVGSAISGVTDLLGIDSGGSRPATMRSSGRGRTGRTYYVT